MNNKKRKRDVDVSALSMSSHSSKKPSSRRRSRVSSEDDDIECIELDSETDNNDNGASSSKKKKVDKSLTETAKPNKGGKPEVEDVAKTGKGKESKLAFPQNPRSSIGKPEQNGSKDRLCQPLPSSRLNEAPEFKVPDLPTRPNLPSTIKARSFIDDSTDAQSSKPESKKPKMKKNKHSEQQFTKTSASRNLRKAFIGVIQENLEDASLDIWISLKDLIDNIAVSIPNHPSAFATRLYPGGAKFEDASKESEVEEFARWWLFGVSALLFSCPEPVAKQIFSTTSNVLSTLSQLLLNGHPSIVDRIAVQFFKVLKDLLVRNGRDCDSQPTLKINLFHSEHDSEIKKEFNFDIKLTADNEWLIPHYIQAVSPLITRICLRNVKIFHLFNDILRRLLERLTTPETVASVLACFPSFILTDAHSFYLTEDTFSSIFKTILQAPAQPKIDVLKMRHLFSQYDLLQNHRFAEVLQDSGLGLLQIGIKDFLYSDKFAVMNKDDLQGVIAQAFGFVVDGSHKQTSWITEQTVPLFRLVSSVGLFSVLHPLFEFLIFTEISMKISSPNQAPGSSGQAYLARNTSNVWDRIFKCWEDSLNREYQSLYRQESTSNIVSEEKESESLSFFTSTAALAKLSACLIKRLVNSGFGRKFRFFELRHLQRWADISLQSLLNSGKLNPTKRHHLYYDILETIEHLDFCDWCGLSLSAKYYSNLICIISFCWASNFDANMPQRLVPSPTFVKKLCSSLHFIRESSLLKSKAIRCLRLQVFRPWRYFVTEIYTSIMEELTTSEDLMLVVEFLRAIADVSWVFKEAIPLKTTFSFLEKVIKSDLWKGYSNVRSSLAKAITSLPCICHYNVLRSRMAYPDSTVLSRSGCGKQGCTSFVPRLQEEDTIESDGANELDDLYIKTIVALSLPLLRSKFLLLKMTLSNLLHSCHNHRKTPTSSIIFPMIEIALNGHTILCEEIFRKIGLVVTTAIPNPMDANSSNRTLTESIVHQIFSVVITQICARKQAGNKKNRLPLRTREKIAKGVVAFSTVGPMSLSIFVEILKCIIPLVAQTRGNENALTILSQKIVIYFAETHNCQPYELMTRVRYEISKCVVKCALKAFYRPDSAPTVHQHGLHMCVKFIERVKHIGRFRLAFVSYFYPPLMEIIVPRIMESRYQFLLSCLASYVKETEPILLQEYIMNYFPTLLLDHSAEKITQCLKFLKDCYEFDAMFTARNQEQRILNEALFRLSDREDKVLRFLSHLCKWDEQSSKMVLNQGTGTKIPRSELQELLDKKLLGYFIHLDTKLQSRIEITETKQNIIKSFTALMKLMGKNKITSMKSKVYKTLYAATKEGPQFHEVLYNAWKEFANNLDSTSFESMTPQILASILPLRQSPGLRCKVDGLISHFVIYKKEYTASHYHELYFLLDHCEDEKALEAIRHAVDLMKTKNWSDYFNMLVKQASNENPPIRYEAFTKLREVFRSEWELVEKYVLVKGQQYISQMISTLLAGLRGTGNPEDKKLREIIVDCFGAVGALDPVRFRSGDDDRNSQNSLSTGLAISGQMSTFIILYITELVREFNEVKDTTNFDYCACLIQIVLREMNIIPSNPHDNIWRFLTKEQQDTITPMFTTKYLMDHGPCKIDFSCPIYLSKDGESFENWLVNWMCKLISYITRTEKPDAYRLFTRSMSVLRTNVRISTFIIPFVAMYAIFCATAVQIEEIVIEIKTVLERWTVLNEMKQKEHSICPIKDSEVEHGVVEEAVTVENESIFHARCTQVIFAILDHLLRSSSLAKRKLVLRKAPDSNARRGTADPVSMSESDLEKVESVLKEIPRLLISEVACNCASFPSALYYLEQELKTMPLEEKLQTNIDYLQRLYICLDDMDSVSGIPAVRMGPPSFAGLILENIVNGKTLESVKSLEQKAITDTDDFQLHQALVRAYLKVEEPHAAETFINATLVRQPEWELDLQEVHMEALVKLQKWPELNAKVDELEGMEGNQYIEEKFLSWNVAIPRVISKLQRNEWDAAAEVVTELKGSLAAPLVATCTDMYPYMRAYPSIVQIHILSEIDEAMTLLRKYSNTVSNARGGASRGRVHKDLIQLVSKWEARLWNVSKSRKMVDQILKVRKSIFQIMKSTFQSNTQICDVINSAIRECWLDVARYASKCGDFTQADNCLREAKQFMSPKVMIEEAKILNRKGEKGNAVATLKEGITTYFPKGQIEKWKKEDHHLSNRPSLLGAVTNEQVPGLIESKLLCSKALLLLAKLSEEQKLLDMEDYIAKYKEAADVYKESEKNFFTLASYHDRLWSAADKSQPLFDVQANVVRYYSQSLYYGCKYVYQSLPRLLSIWFDLAAGLQSGEFVKFHTGGIPPTAPCSSSSGGSNDSGKVLTGKPLAEACLDIMNNAISRMSTTVPAYVLMTAFTQLVSRLCHTHAPTWALLKEIIVRIICTHPYQTLWLTMALHKSVNSTRRKRCLEIYKSVDDHQPHLKAMIRDYTNITEKFIDLCNKNIDRTISVCHLSKVYDKLPRMIRQMGSNKVAVPVQVFINPSLPRKGISHKDHNPYPESLVYIEGIDDKVELMTSLVRPKKITLKASNGKSYGLMCKPTDDLRKDSKVMEVNNVVNWYLSQNSESSQRRLHVNTYSVVPLNEECGLLEWVPNLTTLRLAINTLYKEKNIKTALGLPLVKINLQDPIEVKRKKFIDVMLKQTPPVFGDWFFNQFNDHQSWYTARMSYIRTAAVMSIVGYIMGLGDRHGENILLDTTTGEVVHVDFNCLFNKGEGFQWPERVPFRLTQNMVDGMGPLKYEGVFRKSCEIVMNMFREHKSIFLSVLRPFVFDPLVEWQKFDKKILANLEAGELTNEKAVETMKYIRHRLNGTARNMMKDINTERSVKAHVNYLIEEATSIDNLCQMWLGWAAHM